MSMSSPETSGAILTSTSGWIFPVAVTTWVIVLRKALSVVIGMPLSRLRAAIESTAIRTISAAPPMMPKSFLRERLPLPVPLLAMDIDYERVKGGKSFKLAKKSGWPCGRLRGRRARAPTATTYCRFLFDLELRLALTQTLEAEHLR